MPHARPPSRGICGPGKGGGQEAAGLAHAAPASPPPMHTHTRAHTHTYAAPPSHLSMARRPAWPANLGHRARLLSAVGMPHRPADASASSSGRC
eukprot:360311-Chlamydomonas_euryale.AAC.8